MELTRRDALRALATGAAATAGLAAFGTGTARAADLGTLIDYSAGVPSAHAVRAAGYKGVIRYCSDRRPGAEWMHAKPLRRSEADAMRGTGLQIVSCYQYGKAETSDWRGGYDAGVHHATRGLELHRAAGGPAGAPIYMSIDSNPTDTELRGQVLPYLRGCESILGHGATGVYCNAPTIDWLLNADLGSFFWQHDWGSGGRIHSAAHLHQRSDRQGRVDGIEIDLNTILKPRYGQWSQAPAGAGVAGGGAAGRGGTAPLSADLPELQELAGDLRGSADPATVLRNLPGNLDRIPGLLGRAAELGARFTSGLG